MTHKIDNEATDKLIENVAAIMRLSGFIMTEAEKDLLRRISTGEASYDLEIRRIVYKAKKIGQNIDQGSK